MRCGLIRRSWVWFGAVRFGRHGSVRCGSVRFGGVRQVWRMRSVTAWSGLSGRYGEVEDGAVWSRQAWQARFNRVR